MNMMFYIIINYEYGVLYYYVFLVLFVFRKVNTGVDVEFKKICRYYPITLIYVD